MLTIIGRYYLHSIFFLYYKNIVLAPGIKARVVLFLSAIQTTSAYSTLEAKIVILTIFYLKIRLWI